MCVVWRVCGVRVVCVMCFRCVCVCVVCMVCVWCVFMGRCSIGVCPLANVSECSGSV